MEALENVSLKGTSFVGHNAHKTLCILTVSEARLQSQVKYALIDTVQVTM